MSPFSLFPLPPPLLLISLPITGELSAALDAAASARRDLALAQQQIGALRADNAAMSTRMQLNENMTQRHAQHVAEGSTAEIQVDRRG